VWEVETGTTTGMVPTPIADEDVVYTFGGEGDSHAIRFARGVADESRVAWKGRNIGLPSPVMHDGRIILVDSRGIATVLEAGSGEVAFHERLAGRTGTVYASPSIAGGRLYVVSRERGTFVYSTDSEFELLAHNRIEDDDTKFNASPAFAGDQLFLRSQKRLYCIAES
jgi:outer membrane protein assembly factor BamB